MNLKNSKIKYEYCVSCMKKLDIPVDTPVGLRKHYIHGCGQLCESCCYEIEKTPNKYELSNEQLEYLIKISTVKD